jgi:hypothetical protein
MVRQVSRTPDLQVICLQNQHSHTALSKEGSPKAGVVVPNNLKKIFANVFLERKSRGQAWWQMPVIPAIWKVEVRRLQFESSPGKNVVRFHLNQQV